MRKRLEAKGGVGMQIPNNFCALLIRGIGLDKQEEERIKTIYGEYGKEEIYEFAKKKKILPFAANAFVNYKIEEEFWGEILNIYRERNKSILLYLDKVYKTLLEAGVRKMFVSENFAALLSANSDLALFASGDIDNYADPDEKEKIYRAFECLGCRRKERFSGKHQIAAEFFPHDAESLPEGFYISVDFYPLARLKLPCFVNADDFVEWDGLYTYGNTHIVLPPINALTYICMLHISLHSFSRAPDIRLYIDLLNLSKLQINFTKVQSWAIRDKTQTRLAVATELSNYLMKTSFPEDIIHNSKQKEKVEMLVYDKRKEDLRYEPNSLDVLRIEINCDDDSAMHGLFQILFPDTEWMKKVYGSSGLIAHILHIKKVL